jgi:hypothetical protein
MLVGGRLNFPYHVRALPCVPATPIGSDDLSLDDVSEDLMKIRFEAQNVEKRNLRLPHAFTGSSG